MVIIYALCWLPLHCITVVGDLESSIWDFEHIKLVWNVCHWLAVSSCCWNPIVYYWTNDTLRAGFLYALGMWCPCVSRPPEPPTACRRQVVYQSTLRVRGSDVQVDTRRPAAFVQRSSPRMNCHIPRKNLHRSNDVELRQLRAPTSAGQDYSTALLPAARAATRSC